MSTNPASTVPTAKDVANRLNVDIEEKTYKNPATTVDALVVRKNMKTNNYELLVIQRGRNPFKGYWALPGGFVEYREDPLDAAPRELEEESKLKKLEGPDSIHLITVRGKGDRDPRQHIITIAYALKVDPASLPNCAGSDDATGAQWIPMDVIGSEEFPLAFDHVHIVNDFKAWFQKEGEARGYYVIDENPQQPGESSTKH
ncbi:NUDIX hydrolase domain-like protein [Chytridium lagenaria]|nr:NUDIX hydrolase domain-like protein [Chytridium lagenaria]